MACKITVIKKPDYVHFIVTGENTAENTLRYLQDIYEECATHHYQKILIEEHLEGQRLTTMDIYDIASKASKNYLGFFKAIAYVNPLTEKKTVAFIENLCVNRSLPLHAFLTVEEAEKWLSGKR